MTFNGHLPEIPGPLCPSNPLFSDLELLKVDDIFKMQVAKFIFLCLARETPSIFLNWFTLSSAVHSHNTVTNSVVIVENYFDVGTVQQIPTLHTKNSNLVNYGGKLIQVAGPILWNGIPAPVRESSSLFTFKIKMKKCLLHQYTL